MWLYYGLIIYIISMAGFIYLDGANDRRDKIYLLFTMGLFLVLSALRSEYVGNDTDNYIYLFNEVKFNGINTLTERYEFGYLLMNDIISKISSNPQAILIVTSIFIFIGHSKFIFKYSENKWLSVYMFFTLIYFGFSMSGIRQAIAIVILFVAYGYMIDNKKIKFLISVIVATMFHNTAILFIIAYPISKLKCNKKTILLVTMFTIIFYFIFPVISKLSMSVFPRFNYYLGSEYFNGQVRSSSILNLIIFLSIFIFSSCIKYNHRESVNLSKLNMSQDKIEKCRNSEMMLLLTSISIMFLSLKLNILDRVAMYFHIYCIIILPNSINMIKNKNYRIVIIIGIIYFLFIYSTTIKIIRPEWQSIFPYTFYWI